MIYTGYEKWGEMVFDMLFGLLIPVFICDSISGNQAALDVLFLLNPL